MALFYATKYRREPGGQPRRVESIGFHGLAAALATVRTMNEAARPDETWIGTVRVDGAHVPAVVGTGGGAAVLIRAGCYDLEPADMLEPLASAAE